jgi:hypothetical protein
MSPKKSAQKMDIARSSAAEYLTFIAATGEGEQSVEMRYQNENIWLTQKMMAALYDVTVAAINQHLKHIFEAGELLLDAVIKEYLITASDQKTYNTKHYNLQAIIAVGFKINKPRADAEKQSMELRTWEAAPGGKIIKADVAIAKNYLNDAEMQYLERIVSLYLDFAEFQAERKIPMSMEDWAKRLDSFLEFNGSEILTGAGKISHEQAKLHAETEFEKYRIVQDRLFQSDFDRFMALAETSQILPRSSDEQLSD